MAMLKLQNQCTHVSVTVKNISVVITSLSDMLTMEHMLISMLSNIC